MKFAYESYYLRVVFVIMDESEDHSLDLKEVLVNFEIDITEVLFFVK